MTEWSWLLDKEAAKWWHRLYPYESAGDPLILRLHIPLAPLPSFSSTVYWLLSWQIQRWIPGHKATDNMKKPSQEDHHNFPSNLLTDQHSPKWSYDHPSRKNPTAVTSNHINGLTLVICCPQNQQLQTAAGNNFRIVLKLKANGWLMRWHQSEKYQIRYICLHSLL